MNEESILQSLFWLSNEQHPINNSKIKEGFAELRSMLTWLSDTEFDRIHGVVSDLCLLHCEASFAEGVRIGISLIREIEQNNTPRA